jgi:anti-sigma factor RsiW
MDNHESMKRQLASLALGELPEPERSEVRAHVNRCDECRAELQQLERLLGCAERRRGVSADEPLHESARNQLFAAMRSEETMETTARPGIRRVFTWRRIMTSSIVKMAVAAVIVVAVALFGLTQLPASTGVRLLATACAAEESLFAGTKIVHIQNEIIVHARSVDGQAGEPNYTWIPMGALKPDGQLQLNQLKLTVAPESYVVTDHSWYDPVSGCFSRVLKAGDAVVFANSFDGRTIYGAAMASEGAIQVVGQPVSEGFQPPQSPAEYLGIAAGLKTSLAADNTQVQSVEAGTLADGRPVTIFKVGMPKPDGEMDSYWLFKVRDDDSTIAEKEFVLSGRPQLLIRRVLTESVDVPAVAWNLAGIELSSAGTAQGVSITPDMVVPNVSVERMVERATFETYVFSTKPAWTGAVDITDAVDSGAPNNARMFAMAARAEDGRHLVLVQSPTYNALLGRVVTQGQIVYTSPNGFKVWGGGPQKWYSGILLQSAQYVIKDPPSEDRTGYVLQSPAGTFPALAINGPVTDEELHRLVDSLVPAKQYLSSRATDPNTK